MYILTFPLKQITSVHCSFIRDKCPEDMSEVPDFLPLAQFQLRPEKQIVSVFVDIAREDGYVYAEDLATVVWLICYK